MARHTPETLRQIGERRLALNGCGTHDSSGGHRGFRFRETFWCPVVSFPDSSVASLEGTSVLVSGGGCPER